MPTMDVAHQHMLSARAHGGDQMDWTALVGGERISAGLKPFGSRVCLFFFFLTLFLFLLSPLSFPLFLADPHFTAITLSSYRSINPLQHWDLASRVLS